MNEAIQPCKDRGRGRVEVVVVGNDHLPLQDAFVEIEQEGQICRSKCDADGLAIFDGLVSGPLTLRLAGVDATLWEVAADVELDDKKSKGNPSPMSAVIEDENDAGGTYLCKAFEAPDAIAARFGVPVDGLTRNGTPIVRQNATHEGDSITIPARALRRDSIELGRRYLIVRWDVPFTIVIRLRDENHFPRMGRPYLLKVKMSDGSEPPYRQGVTDEHGRVVETVPFEAATGELLISEGRNVERIRLRFGALPAVTEDVGIQERLEKLGFSCNGKRGELGDASRRALQWFQYAIGLAPIGDPDEETRSSLVALHGS